MLNCNVKESGKDVIPLSRSAPKVNVNVNVKVNTMSISIWWNSDEQLLCNPDDKPTNQEVDTGGKKKKE